MGDAQSAQRESRNDAAEEEEEEEGGTVDDARLDGNTEDKPLKKSGEFAEINGKTDSTITEVNHHCEDEIAADDKDVSETARQLKEKGTTLENVEINDKEPPNEADVNEDVPLEMTEMDEKQNDINEGFKRFFSNIGLKLTVKKGSVVKDEITTDVSGETNIEDTAKEPKSANTEQNIDLSAQEAIDNDSTACPTLTDVTSHDILEKEEEKTPEAEEEVEPDNVDTATSAPVGEDEKAQQDAIEEDLNPESTSSPEAEEAVSPVKRFFTTGIFSGLRKKKKATGDETIEKELVDMGGKETEIQQEGQQDVETATVDTKHKENGHKEEILSAASDQTVDDGKSPSTNPVTIIINEPEIASAPDKVQDSPLKRLLSGSNLKKLSKKQKVRKSSNTTLSDSEEPFSDQPVSRTTSAETQKEERLAQQLAEATGEEEGAWASFKKLVTPKKQMKKPSFTNEETQIPGSEEETKPSEKEQISDHSTEEKKRKDSSVSWEAVLCGSGRRRSRSRKTSDSEEESPQVENDNKKQELPLESSNEADEPLALSPRQPGSPEGDVGSTWKSFKKLVTPKRKAKDEEESKDNNTQSDSEVTQEESSFSIKKLLPGRKKKKKSAENQDQVSSDEADKEVASGDEDSETPAVIPLSEFDTIETTVQVDVESHVAKEADHQLQQDPHDQMAEPVLPCDSVQTETKKVQDSKDTIKEEVSTALVSNEEPEDLTETSSKHQPLSDIPEEGFITETNVSEEAARDDTIAEDLIEITSEAITAPEPADITLADDTEMISAVSQLSESSNTSGNTTPVPVDYDVKHTEALLYQVVENISINPDVVPVGSDEVNSEIVGSVSHQILETFVKEKPTILEIHRKSDAIGINQGLTVEELDMIDELTVTPQTESISEVNKAVSTEIVNEVPKEEAVTAEIAVDEVYQVNISHPEESIKELGSTEDSQHLVKGQPEADEAGSTETLPEGEAIVAVQSSLVGAHQEEKEPIAINSQEAEFTATVAEENKDGGAEEEAQTLTPEEEQILHNIIDQVQVENKDQEVKELQELPAVQIVIYDSEDGSSQLLGNKVISEVIPAEETVTDKPNTETEPVMEYTVEAEMENKLQADDAPTEHADEPEVLEAVQIAILDLEDGSAKALEKDVVSEVNPAEETAIDKPKEETDPLTECKVEAENENILQADSAKTEHVEEPEVLEAAQTATSDSEEGSAPLLEKEVISEVIPAEETATGKPKEETEPVTEYNVEAENGTKLQADSAPTELAEEPEVLEAVQTATLDSEEGSAQLLEKDVITEVIPADETATDKSKETTEPQTECKVEAENENILQVDAAQTENAEKLEVLEAAQTARLDSEEGTAHLLEKEVISDVIPAEGTATDKPKEETEPVTEYNVEAENKSKLQVDAAQTEHADEPEAAQTSTLDSDDVRVQLFEKEVITEVTAEETVSDKPNEEPKVLEAVQIAPLDIEKNGVRSPQGEVSENILAAETFTDETKQATENLVGASSEPEHQELKTDTPTNDQVAEVLGTVQVPTSESEEGSVKSLEKISETTIDAETVTDEPNEETVPPTEVGESVDALETEHVQEPEVFEDAQDSEEGSAQPLEKKVISEEIPPAETVPHELTPGLSAEDAKTEHDPADAKDIATGTEAEVEAPMPAHVVTQSIEEGRAEKLEKKVLFEDVPNPDTKHAIASITVETETRVVAELNQALRRNEVQETESTLQDVQVGNEEQIPEVVEELQTLAVLHVPSVNDEASSFQVREITVFSEVTPATCVENAAVANEPSHEVHLSAVESSVGEERGEIPGFEIKSSAVEHAIVAQVITCCLKDVAAAIPDALIETTSDSQEPLIDSMANEQEFKETSETTTPLEKTYVTKRGEECSPVMMMNVPSVQSEDNHRIQVQVVDVDIKSAKMLVDTALEVGATEAKEVMEVCRETVEEVDVLSATSETEEKLINEENKVTIQEVIQHVKENLPETAPESAPANLEQEVIKEMDAVTEPSEITKSELSEVEDNFVTCRERQEEKQAVKCDASTTGQQVFKDLMETPICDTPGRPDVSIHDPKGDLEEPKAEVEKSEARVTTEEVKLSPDVKRISEKAQTPQIAQSLVVTPNTGIIVPQNTGIISSIGNVESPSSLSLEFKLNIRFGHTKEPASPPPPTTERVEPVKQTDVAEVGIQAGEPREEINPTQRAGRQNQESTEVTRPANVASTERPIIINPPVLLDVRMQTVELVEPAEQMKSPERGTPNVQAAETIQTVRQGEKKEASLSPAILCEVCDQETRAEEPLKHTEEENDQDVWMDAEEDIYSQGEMVMSLHEVVEEEVVQHEFEAAPNSRMEEGESQQGVLEKGGACETESDGEDFAVAHEDPAIAAASVTTMERD